MLNLKQLRDRRANVIEDGKAAVAQYTSEGRDPTEEEMTKVKALVASREDYDKQIKALEEREVIERSFEVIDTVTVGGGKPLIEKDPKHGFKSFGEFAASVHKASKAGGYVDPRLAIGAAPTTVQNENTGADGGFLVPPEFASTLHRDALDDEALLPLTDEITIGGNSMTFPASEATPWGSGITAYWDGENDQMTQSKDALKTKTLRLNRLTALVPMTEELLSDASALESFISGRTSEAIRWKTNDAILNGDGVGKPLGIVGHAGTVSVTKESAQDAASIVIENLTKMFSRAINPMRSEWLFNISDFPQLYDMKDNSGNRVWQTANPGLSAGSIGMILGRPARIVEACPALGTVGDIIFGDLKQYQSLTKAGGVQTATSMHLWFDYGTTAFRAIYRIDGQPWRTTTVSPGKGSTTRGHFVTLATRA